MNTAPALAFAASLLLLSAAPVHAQGGSAGLVIGANWSRIAPEETGQAVGMRPGLTIGASAGAQILTAVGIQFEALYTQKHSRITTGSREDDLNLDYFEIPILAEMKLFKGLKILEGIAFGFPMRAQVVSADGSKEDIKDDVTNPDIGIVIGVVFPAGKVGIEGRYEGGFKKLEKAESAGTQRNRSFSLNVRIPLK